MKAVVVILVSLSIPFNLAMAYNHGETYCKADNAIRSMVGEAYVSPYCD